MHVIRMLAVAVALCSTAAFAAPKLSPEPPAVREPTQQSGNAKEPAGSIKRGPIEGVRRGPVAILRRPAPGAPKRGPTATAQPAPTGEGAAKGHVLAASVP